MGQIMDACSYSYEGVADAFVVEARACERALLFAVDMSFRRIILEGDSLTIVKKLISGREDRSILKPISQNIRRIAGFLEEVSYRFFPKGVNGVAHTLASEWCRCRSSRCWVEEALASVENIVAEEWLAWL
ncbi:hypothetical protein J1N35_004400 [Gossypium stocksii]|uniref:RNase H type-1 domain-containing protein n=1 Tax=Gossypium stocksii TaxID=47602 RepID=A0A9D3WDG1_9ROSI|nr:hypothetical protein J1N35_004400 [Gossypium stocksii]